MSRDVQDRILKDANGGTSQHLRYHVHLTNCIHLQNQMHKQSPVLTDKSLMRELIFLQRSRSLRDPSASPPSWHSTSHVDSLPKKCAKDAVGWEGRVTEYQRESKRLSGSSPTSVNLALARVIPDELLGANDLVAAISEQSCRRGARDGRKVGREGSAQKSSRTDIFAGNADSLPGHDGNHSVHEAASRNFKFKDRRNKQKGKRIHNVQPKTLAEQLNDVPQDVEDATSPNIRSNGRHSQMEKLAEELGTSFHGRCSGLNGIKGRKPRGVSRTRTALAARNIRGKSELSAASSSLVQGSSHPVPRYNMEDEEEYADQSLTRAPKNSCGIPLNWSRIHHGGKTFLDMAGRSLSCGLADSRFRKGSPAAHGREASNMPVLSDHSSSSTNAEALPLLVEASGSQEGDKNAGWVNDYSGELGIFMDNSLTHEVDSELASEGRSGDWLKLGENRHRRHQNLTQKYMPRTFRDLVGQNLVAQALSNAVMRRKVGTLYIFHGPHGTGKTSCARVFARALNCRSSVDTKPCGFCQSCIAHDMGKSKNTMEVGPVSNFDFESIMELLDKMIFSQLPSHFRVFIFDDCDALSPDCWSALLKVIDQAPRHVVFILISSTLDVLPHIILSRCQKFFFPKLKEADIICTLQLIASKEDIEIDEDAIKLIASRSDGSLRDAEMTLDQLSLLGQNISVPLVQELVGLISDEKLVDLLDLALSADTVNTVKNLRAIMETGGEPLALMSQFATVITNILAGSYDFMKDRPRRKFFRSQPLSREHMEKLRQALKILSEAEKQLRVSNDKLTWLTAALLQLAPDQQYLLSSSSPDTGLDHDNSRRDVAGNIVEYAEMPYNSYDLGMNKGIILDRRRQAGVSAGSQHTACSSGMINRNGKPITGRSRKGVKEIWFEVLERIQIRGIRELLYQEGKLISVSLGAAPTVHLVFASELAKSTAEKFRGQILEAFESVLGSPVTILIRCESRKDAKAGCHLPASSRGMNGTSHQHQLLHSEDLVIGNGEIVEVAATPMELRDNNHTEDQEEPGDRSLEDLRVGEVMSSQKRQSMALVTERRRVGCHSDSGSMVRSKVPLLRVICQSDGCSEQNGWSKRKAVSIAEKLEQENLRLEPRARNLLCWRAARVTRRKLSRLKIRTRRPHSLLNLVSCGKCLPARSPKVEDNTRNSKLKA